MIKKTFFVLMSLLLGNTVVFSADETLREDNTRHRGRLMERFHHFKKRGRHAEKNPVPLSDLRKKEAVRPQHTLHREQRQYVLQHRPHMQQHHHRRSHRTFQHSY